VAGDRDDAAAPVVGILFGFLLGVGALATAAALSGFAIALVRGGGTGAARWLALVAVVGIGGAVVVAGFSGATWTTRSVAVGFAGAGAATAIAVAVRWVVDGGKIGPLEIAVLGVGIGGIVAAPWLAERATRASVVGRFASLSDRIAAKVARSGDAEAVDGRTARLSEVLLILAGTFVLIAALAYVLPSGPLGHDESVYALKARSWLEGTPATGFGIYRPVGIPAVGWIVLHFSDTEVAFRSAAVLLSAATAITMWAVGRTMLGPSAALLGTALFVVSESFLRRATEFLNDLSSAALLLVVMFFVWLHFERYPDRWWLLAAAPAAAAAYYFRYGTVLSLVVIAVLAGTIWYRRLIASRWRIAATAGLLLLLLLPHFAYSRRITGSAFGVLQSARTAVGGGGGGLADYAGWIPEHLAGTFGAVVIVAGVVYTIMIVLRARDDARNGAEARTAVFLTLTALVTTVLLGLFTHGEPRFVYLPLMALLLVGARAAVMLLAATPVVPRRIAIGVLAVVVAYALASGAAGMHNRMAGITGSRDVLAETGFSVKAAAAGSACTVESAYIPELTWYSVCATHDFGWDGPDGDAAYLVLFDESDRQPSQAELDAMLSQTSGVPLVVVPDDDDVYGDGEVYEFVP
jgi:Dolichyl-phosphate-mannose-protein mannosyltransferase